MSFCDRVNKELEGPQISVRLLAHKIQSPQEREALYALTVSNRRTDASLTNTTIKNSGFNHILLFNLVEQNKISKMPVKVVSVISEYPSFYHSLELFHLAIQKLLCVFLQVIESCVKNCGKRFHQEIGKFRFLNEMIKVVSPKVIISIVHQFIRLNG